MCSGMVVVGSRLDTVLKRINAAPIQHQCNTQQHGKSFWSSFCLLPPAHTSVREKITTLMYAHRCVWLLFWPFMHTVQSMLLGQGCVSLKQIAKDVMHATV